MKNPAVELNSSFLPQILLNVIVEGGFLHPAGGEEGLADDLLDVGGDGAAATMIVVIAPARKEVDEVVLDGAFQTARHVVVHLLEAEGHADWFVGTVVRAICFLSHWISEIYSRDNRIILRNIVHQDAAKAMLLHGTILTLAHSIVLRHFAELVIPGLDGVGFHCFVFMFNIIMFAKLRRFYDVCKFFTKKY